MNTDTDSIGPRKRDHGTEHWAKLVSFMRYFALTTFVLLGITLAASGESTGAKAIPPFSEVRSAVVEYFKKVPGLQAGDLITRDQVEPLLRQFQKVWLPSDEAGQILGKVSAKGEFLVDQLSTPNGRRFMRRVAALPDGYDRLDRLCRLPQGQQTVRMLVQDPRGDRMIEYLTSAKGGHVLGQMLSQDPGGARFNTATGRIYTVAMLLARLQQSYAAAVTAAKR